MEEVIKLRRRALPREAGLQRRGLQSRGSEDEQVNAGLRCEARVGGCCGDDGRDL